MTVVGPWIFVDPVDGTQWSVDMDFMASNWGCTWGDGCQGILERRAPELAQGCCSVGAEVLPEEAGLIEALGLSLDPDHFQFSAEAEEGGVFADRSRSATRVVKGACIFLNRPGFDGGVGCALHLAAVHEGERPMDYKPAICWQLPLKVEVDDDGVRHLRRWRASDWGDEQLAWCCTEPDADPSAYRSEVPVAISLAGEISGVVGPEVAEQVRRAVAQYDSKDHQNQV